MPYDTTEAKRLADRLQGADPSGLVCDQAAASLRDAVAEIERLREALAFYADMTGDGYDVMVTSYGLSTELGCIIKDGGDKARALLGDTHE